MEKTERTVDFDQNIIGSKSDTQYEFVKKIDQGEFSWVVKPKKGDMVRQVNEFGFDVMGNRVVRNIPPAKVKAVDLEARIAKLEEAISWIRVNLKKTQPMSTSALNQAISSKRELLPRSETV